MMHLVRRASLLVAFYILTSAATAAAECAWVLWGESWLTSKTGSHTPSKWEIVTAAPTAKGCETARTDYLTRHTSASMSAIARETGIISVPLKEELSGVGFENWLRPVCLPDTMDPRGPKGK